MRDINADHREVSAHVEEELKLQWSGGNCLFEDLVQLIKRRQRTRLSVRKRTKGITCQMSWKYDFTRQCWDLIVWCQREDRYCEWFMFVES